MLMARKKKIDVRKMKVGQSMQNMGAALQKQMSKDSEVTLSVVGKGNQIRATESIVDKDAFSYKDRNTLHIAQVDDTKLAPSSDTAAS